MQRVIASEVGMRRLRLAELTSSLGAGVLGLGIGALAGAHLGRVGLPLLIVGLVLHAWGMTDKHRLEARTGVADVWWSTALYWICWALLGGVVIYVLTA